MSNDAAKEFMREMNNEDVLAEIKKNCMNIPGAIQHYENQGFALINMAILTDNLDFAEWLVDNNAEVNTFNDGGTPLSCACYAGNAKLIKKIHKKTNENYLNKSDVMNQAIYSSKKTNLDAAISLGYSVHEQDRQGDTPLVTAISALEEFLYISEGAVKKGLKIVQYLIQLGVQINEKEKRAIKNLGEFTDEEAEENILFYCLRFGMEDLYKLFVANGINPYETNNENISVFARLVSEEREDLVLYTLQHHKPKDTEHSNALFAAKNSKMLRLLLENGVSPNEKVENLENKKPFIKSSVLYKYIVDSFSLEFIEAILDYEADVNVKNDVGWTPLVEALLGYGHTEERSRKIFDLIMKKQPILSNLDVREGIDSIEGNADYIVDIFDLAVALHKYDWFDAYVKQMSLKEEELYQEKSLLALIKEDGPKVKVRPKRS